MKNTKPKNKRKKFYVKKKKQFIKIQRKNSVISFSLFFRFFNTSFYFSIVVGKRFSCSSKFVTSRAKGLTLPDISSPVFLLNLDVSIPLSWLACLRRLPDHVFLLSHFSELCRILLSELSSPVLFLDRNGGGRQLLFLSTYSGGTGATSKANLVSSRLYGGGGDGS